MCLSTILNKYLKTEHFQYTLKYINLKILVYHLKWLPVDQEFKYHTLVNAFQALWGVLYKLVLGCWQPGEMLRPSGNCVARILLCHQPGLGLLNASALLQGTCQKAGGWGGRWTRKGGKEKGTRADSLILWPLAQVLDSWPHHRRNRCKTSQLVSKWEGCQP